MMEKIKIKGGDVYKASSVLVSLNLQKADKDVAMAIVRNAMELKIAKKKMEEKINELRESITKDVKEDNIKEVSRLRDEYSKAVTDDRKEGIVKEINQYQDVLKAESMLNELYYKLEREDDYEVNIDKISLDKFMDNLCKMDVPYSADTIDALQFIFLS